MSLFPESGDIAAPHKKEEEEGKVLNIKDLLLEKKSLIDQLKDLEKEQKTVADLMDKEIAALVKEISEVEAEAKKSQGDVDELKKLNDRLLKNIETLQQKLAAVKIKKENLKKIFRSEVKTLSEYYSKLPELLQKKVNFYSSLKQNENMSLTVLFDHICKAEQELKDINSGVWSGYSNQIVDGKECKVKVLYFGSAAGCWLSLDEKVGGQLNFENNRWHLTRSDNDLEVISQNFKLAERGLSFYMPMDLHKKMIPENK